MLGFKKSFDKQINSTGFDVFRIFYSIVLLFEIGKMYYFRHLIFDRVPYLYEAEINFGIPIAIWFFSVLLVLFGAFTRFATILNYLLGLILIGSIKSFEYHVFYAYMGINFFLIFLPISNVFSIDRLLLKLKYSNTKFQYIPTKKTNQLYYFILPLVAIGFVYFDSVFYKLSSQMWLDGLGSWLPSSLPMITHTNNSWFLNNEWLIKIIGWLTIIFEAIFIFIFFRKKWRVPVFIVGFILHLGILIQFPIPLFALTVCAVYVLIIPVGIWQKIFKVKNKSSLIFYYDTDCPLCIRTKIIIQHFDWFNKIEFKTVQYDSKDELKLIGFKEEELLNNIYCVSSKGKVYKGVDSYIMVMEKIFYLFPFSILFRLPLVYFIVSKVYSYVALNRTREKCTEENCGYNPPKIVNDTNFKLLKNLTLHSLKYKTIVFIICTFTILQFGRLYYSWLVNDIKVALNLNGTKLDTFLYEITSFYTEFGQIGFGITGHAVFSNEIHFDDYNHIVAVTYLNKENKEIWLPIIDKNGMPDYYIYGANWVNYTFRVNGLYVNNSILEGGLRRYIRFWAKKNDVDLQDDIFLIKVKKIESPKNGWEKDFLNKQIAKPWVDGGYIKFQNNQGTGFLKQIESL